MIDEYLANAAVLVRIRMFETDLNLSCDVVLFAVAFVCILIGSVFRLDELIVRPRGAPNQRKHLIDTEQDGEPVMSDPDGRPWRRPSKGR
jgi:hypothetical protein